MTATTLADISERFRHPQRFGNVIRDRSPFTLLTLIASATVAALAVPGWEARLLACIGFVLLAVWGGVGRSFSLMFLKLWVVLGVVLFVLRALFTGGHTVLVSLGPLSITAEGVSDGLQFAAAVMTICGAVLVLFALVPMQRFMLALELRGLSPKASYIVLASLQAISDLGKTAAVVLDAQRARGVETEGSIFVRAKAFFPVLAPVFLAAMSSTEERAIALDARAFNAQANHSHLVALPTVPSWERLLAVAFVAGAVSAIAGRIVGWF